MNRSLRLLIEHLATCTMIKSISIDWTKPSTDAGYPSAEPKPIIKIEFN